MVSPISASLLNDLLSDSHRGGASVKILHLGNLLDWRSLAQLVVIFFISSSLARLCLSIILGSLGLPLGLVGNSTGWGSCCLLSIGIVSISQIPLEM